MKLCRLTIAVVAASLSLLGCSNKNNQKKDPNYSSKRRHSAPHSKAMQDKAPQPIVFRADGTLSIVSPTGIKLATIEYERAETPETRAQGLMYRSSMDERQGMLFIYENTAPRYMYMKNTYIPLDILFLDHEKKIIKIHQNTQPLSEDLLPSINNAHYALEANAGFCTQHSIHEGDLLDF